MMAYSMLPGSEKKAAGVLPNYDAGWVDQTNAAM